MKYYISNCAVIQAIMYLELQVFSAIGEEYSYALFTKRFKKALKVTEAHITWKIISRDKVQNIISG